VLLFRYLTKEVFITLASLTIILMLIFMSNQLIGYLNRAALGKIPVLIIMQLMMLELPNLIGLLLPLGFYVALLLAYGRLYADSEMIVMQACGYGPSQLLKHSLIMASGVALVVGSVMIFATPYIAIERAKLLRSTGIQTLIQTIAPGRFLPFPSDKQVFYVESMSRDHKKAGHVFVAKQSEKNGQLLWDILWADSAFAERDKQNFEEYVVLQAGKEYQGVPGQANYQISEFSQYKARLPHPEIDIKDDIRTASTWSLFPLNNPDRVKATELQWRLSVPIMVFTLTLIAVPLSRVNPRVGKFARLMPAVLIYILYANLMFFARDAMMQGRLPTWLGMWWLHGLAALLGLFLLWRNKVTFS
jgi:lipopolysaccharide export system permease protein